MSSTENGAEGNGPLSVIEACRVRHSCRNYDSSKWTQEQQNLVENIVESVNQIPKPFGTGSQIGIHGPGLARIGAVGGESGWILLKVPQDQVGTDNYDKAQMDAAFLGINAVMRLTQHGIGTVWVAGTYNEGLAESTNKGWKVPGVIAFGVSNEGTKRMMERIMSWFGPAKGRNPFNTFFYDKSKGKMIEEGEAGKYLDLLMSIRQCPSSLNGQTIRVTIDGDNKFTLFNSSYKSYTVQDSGIGLGLVYFFTDGKVTYDPTPSDEKFATGGKYICHFTITDESVFQQSH